MSLHYTTIGPSKFLNVQYLSCFEPCVDKTLEIQNKNVQKHLLCQLALWCQLVSLAGITVILKVCVDSKVLEIRHL